MFRYYSMLVTLCKISEGYSRFLGTNGFHGKAKNDKSTAAGWRCRQNLSDENFASLSSRLRLRCVPKSEPLAKHGYFSSFNQSSLICGVCRCRSRGRFLNSPRTRLVPYFHVSSSYSAVVFNVSNVLYSMFCCCCFF